MALYPVFLLFSGSCAGLSRLQASQFSKDGLCATVSSSENEEMGQRQTVEAIEVRFQKRPPASTPNATADDCMGDCT